MDQGEKGTDGNRECCINFGSTCHGPQYEAAHHVQKTHLELLLYEFRPTDDAMTCVLLVVCFVQYVIRMKRASRFLPGETPVPPPPCSPPAQEKGLWTFRYRLVSSMFECHRASEAQKGCETMGQTFRVLSWATKNPALTEPRDEGKRANDRGRRRRRPSGSTSLLVK